MKRHLDKLRESTESVDLDALRAGLPADLSTLREDAPRQERSAEVVELRPPRWPLAVGGLLAAAAAGLFFVLSPADTAPELPVEPPAPLAVQASLGSGQLAVGEHVILTADGVGVVAGTTMAPEIRWESGTLRVEVEPQAGVELSVTTDEGRVLVHGTLFEVVRDERGTHVSLERGSVGVVCADRSDRTLEPGQAHSCIVARPGPRLGRVRELQEAGAEPQDILAAVQGGLEVAEPGSHIEGELLIARFEVQLALGQGEQALQTAEAYLASPKAHRAAEVCALASELAEQSELEAPACP